MTTEKRKESPAVFNDASFERIDLRKALLEDYLF